MTRSNSAAANGRGVPYCNYPPQRHSHWPHFRLIGPVSCGPQWTRVRMYDRCTQEVIDFEFSTHSREAALWLPLHYRGPMARPAPVTVEARPWWRRLVDWFASWIGGAS